MKKIIAITTAVLMITGVLSVTSAHADRKTIEGFILGTGVAILGAAILNEMNTDGAQVRDNYAYQRHTPPVYTPPAHHRPDHQYRPGHYKPRHEKKYRHHKKYANHRRGHWEVEKIWMAPVYERKWNPGHYNRKGKWVSGRYEKFMVQEGYWSKKKVWVRH